MSSGAEGSELQRAYQAGLRLLSYRARSKREMAQRLVRRFSAVAAQEAVAQLEAHGYLDDASFAQEWCRSREAHRPRSTAMLQRELQQHGVSREVAEAALQGMDDTDSAYRAAQHHLKALAGLDNVTSYRRLTDYLRRRGFSYGVARETVERVLRGEGP